MGGYEAEILITDPGQCKTGTDPHVDDAGTDNNYEDEQKTQLSTGQWLENSRLIIKLLITYDMATVRLS